MSMEFNSNETKGTLKTSAGSYTIFNFSKLAKLGMGDPHKLPFSIKILLESALRNYDDYQITFKDIETLLNWTPKSTESKEIGLRAGDLHVCSN